MICKNCGAYYVRPPCPSCGQDGNKDEKATGKQEETTIKPSKLRGGSAVNPNIRTEEQDNAEAVPSFARYDKQEADTISSSLSKSPSSAGISVQDSAPSGKMREKMEKDEVYRQKVKNTVKEVIKLLEELIED